MVERGEERRGPKEPLTQEQSRSTSSGENCLLPPPSCRVENTQSSCVKITSCFYSCWTEQMQESLPAMKLNVFISL